MISEFVEYIRQNWKNKPNSSSPLNADHLNHMEDGIENNSKKIKEIVGAVNQLNVDITKKADSNHTHDLSTMINTLSTASGTPSDADYYVSQYAGGGSQNTTYYRRTMSALWAYIKGKADSVYAKSAQLPVYKRATATRTAKSGTVIYNQYGHIVVVEITDIVVTSTSTWTEISIASGLPKPASGNSSYMTSALEDTWMNGCTPSFHMMGTSLYLVVRSVSCANHQINGTMVYAV